MQNSEIMKQINFYCDESCHIQSDGNPVMSLVSIYCSKVRVKIFNAVIKSLKEKYGFSPYSEMKWNKVSKCNLNFYKEVIDYLANNKLLKIRILIAKHKDEIISNEDKGSYDDWYSKMYYNLLKYPIDKIKKYKATKICNLYMDKKDSKSVEKNKELAKYLWYYFTNVKFNGMACDSKEHELIQLADIIAGASTYYYREDRNSDYKITLMNYIMDKLGIDFSKSSPMKNERCNLFIWNGRDYL